MSARTPGHPPRKKTPAEPAPATSVQSEDEAVALQPLARGEARRAIEALAAVMTDPTAPAPARISAATTLLTWGYGRPQGEGEWPGGNRGEPVIKLKWAGREAPAEKRRARKRRPKRKPQRTGKPMAKPAKPARS
jgi:hypothetical protein